MPPVRIRKHAEPPRKNVRVEKISTFLLFYVAIVCVNRYTQKESASTKLSEFLKELKEFIREIVFTKKKYWIIEIRTPIPCH